MNIGLDATYTLGHEPSGVAVYCSSLIEALAREAGPQDRLFLLYRSNRFLPALLRGRRPSERCSVGLLEDFTCRYYRHRLDLFHGLNARLPSVRFVPTLATFHDLFFLAGDFCTPEFRRRFALRARETADRADYLVAISEFTAGQVAQVLNYPRDRIRVIHSGVNPVPEVPLKDLEELRARCRLPRPFFLHVGTLQKRKNLERLVRAFEGLPEGFDLVLAGSRRGYGGEEILEKIRSSPARARIRHFGYLDRQALNGLYRSATALVFPSLYEGFGLPVLEAMSARLPVIASDRSALKEVVGEAALLVDPEREESIREGMRRLLEDPQLRALLKDRGTVRVKDFSWDRTARLTLDLYRSL